LRQEVYEYGNFRTGKKPTPLFIETLLIDQRHDHRYWRLQVAVWSETKIEGLQLDQVEYRVAGQEERNDEKDYGKCDGGGINIRNWFKLFEKSFHRSLTGMNKAQFRSFIKKQTSLCYW